MKTKSTSLARKARASPTVVARQPRLATVRTCQCPLDLSAGASRSAKNNPSERVDVGARAHNFQRT